MTSMDNFISADRGSVGVMFGTIALVIFGFAGAAIDTGRWYAARSSDEKALDAAVVAGARALQQTGSQAAAIAAAATYFEANGGTGSVEFRTPDATTLTGFVTGNVDTLLASVIGVEVMSYRIASGTRLQTGGGSGSNLEIAVALDVTGSMCADGIGPCTGGPEGAASPADPKMRAMKDAARELINIAVSDDQSERFSKMAIVPFSTRIRVARDGEGQGLMMALTNLPATWSGWYRNCAEGTGTSGSETNGSGNCTRYETIAANDWQLMPCVTDRDGAEEFTDAAPGPWTWLNGHGGNRDPFFSGSSDTAMTSGTGQTEADPSGTWNYRPTAYCDDAKNGNAVLPLTADKMALIDRIEGLEAYGATNGGFATAFAWYMLSPNWDGIWTGQSAPRPYSEAVVDADGHRETRKVAIIMSDGVYNAMRASKELDKTDMSNRAKQLCTAMKDTGIEIFTVGFALDDLPAGDRAIAVETLKSCGSSVEHFYDTLTVSDMQSAFRSIGYAMSSLKLFTPDWPSAE